MGDSISLDFQPISLFDLELQADLANGLETVNPGLAPSIRKILKAGGTLSEILEHVQRVGATPLLQRLIEAFIEQQTTSNS